MKRLHIKGSNGRSDQMVTATEGSHNHITLVAQQFPEAASCKDFVISAPEATRNTSTWRRIQAEIKHLGIYMVLRRAEEYG